MASWKLGFWVAGQRLGDYDAGTSLTDVLGLAGGIIKYSGRRRAPALSALPAEMAYKLIDGAVCGRGDGRFVRYVDDELLTAVSGTLCLTPSIDVFDHCRAYTFEYNNVEKILFRTRLDNPVQYTLLRQGYLAAKTKPFYDWLDELYAQHVAPR